MLTAAQLQQLASEPLAGKNRVGRAIELCGITQEQLAVAVRKSQPQISSIVRGDYSSLPLETARAIAEFFGCAIEFLFPVIREAVAS